MLPVYGGLLRGLLSLASPSFGEELRCSVIVVSALAMRVLHEKVHNDKE